MTYSSWTSSSNLKVKYLIKDKTKPIVCFIPGDLLGNDGLSSFLNELGKDQNVISIDYQFIDWKNNTEAAEGISITIHEFLDYFQLEESQMRYVSYSRGTHIFFLMLEHGYLSTDEDVVAIAPLIKVKEPVRKSKDFRLIVDIARKVLFQQRFKLSYSNFNRRFLITEDLSNDVKRKLYRESIPLNRGLILDKTIPKFEKVTVKSLYVIVFKDDRVFTKEYFDRTIEILKKAGDFPTKKVNLFGAHLRLIIKPRYTTNCLKQIYQLS